MSNQNSLAKFVQSALGNESTISKITPVSGGCIHSAAKVILEDRRVFFLKQNDAKYSDVLSAELKGLESLSKTGQVNVPDPIAIQTVDDSTFLLVNWIEPQAASSDSSGRLGEMLGRLHNHQDCDRFGFEADNFIGSSPQINDWKDAWPEFFVCNRLQPQLKWASEKGYSFAGINSDRLDSRVADLLLSDARPSLLHGDLWSGNYLIGPNGTPFLIDPAPYWGHSEAEFGILTLFGGFDSDFYGGYESVRPFAPGFEERLPIYQLYHYLNHLNLFGSSYLGPCENCIRSLI